MAVFLCYCSRFWGFRALYMFVRHDHNLRSMDDFISYCPQFWGSLAIYMFESYDRKLIFLGFMEVFMSYSPHFWGFRVFYMFSSYDEKLVFFAFYGHFHELLPTVLGFQGDLHVWEVWPKTHRFCVLGLFSWPLAHSFRALGRFTCLRVITKNSYFFAFCGRFHELFPMVLGFQRDL